MAGVGGTQQPQYTPEQRFFMNEQKSVLKLVDNYKMAPEKWDRKRLEKLQMLADKYDIPFTPKSASAFQKARSTVVGAVDSVLFDLIPDEGYIAPGSEGYAKAGKWAGLVIPLLVEGAATIATGGAAAPVTGPMMAAQLARIAKTGSSASRIARAGNWAKKAYQWTAPGLISSGIKGAVKTAGPALAARGMGDNWFAKLGLNMAQRGFIDDGMKALSSGSPTAATDALASFAKAGLNAKQINALKSSDVMLKLFKNNKKQLNRAFKTGGVTPAALPLTKNAAKQWLKVLGDANDGTKITLTQIAKWAKTKAPKLSESQIANMYNQAVKNKVDDVGGLRDLINTMGTQTGPQVATEWTNLLNTFFGYLTLSGTTQVDPFDPYKGAQQQIVQQQ